MYTKYINKNIQETLKARERALARRNIPFGQNSDDAPKPLDDIVSRTPFVRMCSNKLSVPNKVIGGGEMHSADGLMKFGASELYTSGQSGVRPLSGIKNIEVSYLGDYKAIRQATINWVAASIEDLEHFTPYFLKTGQSVILDWGWVKKDFSSWIDEFKVPPVIGLRDNQYKVNQNIFKNPQEIIHKIGGDYDAIGGLISNYEYTLRADGAFDCVTHIKAIGSTLFKKPLDKSGNKSDKVTISLAGGESRELDTNFDGFINGLLNLRNIILYEVFGINYRERGFLDWALSVAGTDRYLEHLRMYAFEMGDERKLNGYIVHKDALKKNTADGYAAVVDLKDNPNVLWMLTPNSKDDIFVSWGWFEDQFLNRYISYRGGEDQTEAKLTIRSIDTKLDEDGNPTITKDYVAKHYKDEGATSETLKEHQLVYGKWGENYNRLLKRLTLIRNHPKLLHPIDPFHSFAPEKLPREVNISMEAGERKRLHKMFFKIKSNFTEAAVGYGKLFRDKDNPNLGKLRHLMINIKEIQKAFGVNVDTNDINPVGTLEKGMENLFTSVSSNFHNYWDFTLALDPYDSTNMKVIDKNTTTVADKDYTKFSNDDEGYDYEGWSSHKVSKLGIYKFPSYKIGSIVKSQNLSFKIPDAMALTVLYSGNKGGEKYTEATHVNNPQLMKLFINPLEKDVFKDRYLHDLETSYHSNKKLPTYIQEMLDKGEIKGDDVAYELAGHKGSETHAQGKGPVEIVKTVKVGSFATNHQSKIGYDFNIGPLNINPKVAWWRRWQGTNIPSDPGKSVDKDGNRVPITKFDIINGEIALVREEVRTRKWEKEVPNTAWTGFEGSNNLYTTEMVTEEEVVHGNFKKVGRAPKFYEYSSATGRITMKSPVRAIVSNKLNHLAKDPIIPTDLTLEVDGIGGIVPGDLIQTDYIQPQYNTNLKKGNTYLGPYTYFQVIELSQKVDSTGWITEIKAKMRINDIKSLEDVTIDEIEPKDFTPVTVEPRTHEVEPPPPRPSIPPPKATDEEPEDVVLDELEFDDFEEWDVPPVRTIISPEVGPGHGWPTPVNKSGNIEIEKHRTKPVQDKQTGEVTYGRVVKPLPTFDPGEEQRKKDLKEQEERDEKERRARERAIANKNKRRSEPKPISTYKGWYWQNDEYLYSNKHKPEWRPEYLWNPGTSNEVMRHFEPTKDSGISFETIKEKKDYNTIRKPYWDEFIERKNKTGLSKLPHKGGKTTADSSDHLGHNDATGRDDY